MNPVANEKRLFGLKTYITLWISSMVVIRIFMIGHSYLPPAGKLNLFQAGVVTIISAFLTGILFVVNSNPRLVYGITWNKIKYNHILLYSQIVLVIKSMAAAPIHDSIPYQNTTGKTLINEAILATLKPNDDRAWTMNGILPFTKNTFVPREFFKH